MKHFQVLIEPYMKVDRSFLCFVTCYRQVQAAKLDPSVGWTINDCIVMLILGVISSLNLIPLTIMLVRLIKSKARTKGLFKSFRFHILNAMILLNLVVISNNIFDLGGIPIVNSQIFNLMRILTNLCTFLIIYLVFKKASKNLENKEGYLRAVKCLFLLSLLTNMILIAYMNI